MTEGTIAQVFEGAATWSVVRGDCLDVLRDLPPQCGVVVTDVPYQVGKQIANDDLPWDEYLPWLDARIAECCRVGRRVFSFFASTRLIRFIRESTAPPAFEINWHKPMMLHDRILNGSPFLAHREPILYWGPMRAKEAGKRGYDSFAVNAMWPRERRVEGIEHPTPKPPELLEAALPYWTDPEELVIDPFCGSGTHVLAAVKLGHPAIGIDIDARWVAETRARILAFERLTSLGAARRGQEALFR